MMIQTMAVENDVAAAKVSDGTHIYKVLMNATREKRCLVLTEDGMTEVEGYSCLQEGVYSRFAGIFLTLQKAINACNKVYSESILHEITSNKEFTDLGDKYTASNIFTYHGREMIACVEYDFSREVPSYMYTVSDTKLDDLEGYEALYEAVNSEYYPVLADLDNYAWKHIPEEKLP